MATVISNVEKSATRREVVWSWTDALGRTHGPHVNHCAAGSDVAAFVAQLEQRDLDAMIEAEMQANLEEVAG